MTIEAELMLAIERAVDAEARLAEAENLLRSCDQVRTAIEARLAEAEKRSERNLSLYESEAKERAAAEARLAEVEKDANVIAGEANAETVRRARAEKAMRDAMNELADPDGRYARALRRARSPLRLGNSQSRPRPGAAVSESMEPSAFEALVQTIEATPDGYFYHCLDTHLFLYGPHLRALLARYQEALDLLAEAYPGEHPTNHWRARVEKLGAWPR